MNRKIADSGQALRACAGRREECANGFELILAYRWLVLEPEPQLTNFPRAAANSRLVNHWQHLTV